MTHTTPDAIAVALARAKAERLISFATSRIPDPETSTLVYTGLVTASQGVDAYEVWIREDFDDNRFYVACACKAGEFGNHPCKHAALVLHDFNLMRDDAAYVLLDADEQAWMRRKELVNR